MKYSVNLEQPWIAKTIVYYDSLTRCFFRPEAVQHLKIDIAVKSKHAETSNTHIRKNLGCKLLTCFAFRNINKQPKKRQRLSHTIAI